MPTALAQQDPAKPRADELRHDLKTLALFISLYCRYQHKQACKAPVQLKTHDVQAIAGRPILLCPQCTKLLAHAFVKRTHCPMDPKPMCKHCPSHCYHPTYREQIRQVMRYSGKKLLFAGRLDYLFHLLF
ncbi:nitrous oxide-stimulated promoter family protein [Fontivita pretiosa]|uniref:nitrous oxide-stimulated promoter family protein n=1 Tax=Fontivita pretiosa TaxID=2989684 RepID=UPI003D174192